MTKWIILSVVFGIFLTGGFYLNRQGQVERLRSEFARLHAEKTSLQQAEAEIAELSRRYAGEADIPAFTEALYNCARQEGIRDHEVITNLYREETLARGGRNRQKGGALEVHRLEVSLAGEFRRIGGYLDRVQKLDGRKKITRLVVVPGETELKAKMTIDLYSLGEAHVR
ncbi:MAG TPA: hypothetical protein DEB35_03485 [Desulfuromonas sp.]|nr:hypothetical protein [Desulfuromonas sp.]